MSEKPNSKIKHIIDSYEDALNMPASDGVELAQVIEVDLENLGNEAVIAGKHTLRDFYQKKLDKLIQDEPAVKSLHEGWKLEIYSYRSKINALQFEIDLLSGIIENPEMDHPAMQKLQTISKNLTGVESTRLLLARRAAYTGIEEQVSKEYGIEFTAASRDSIILRKDDLISLLQLLNENDLD